MGNPRLVIFLRGGLIQEMCSSEKMEILILDYDTEGLDETRKIEDAAKEIHPLNKCLL